jgi:hypothetical protein
MLPRHYSLLLLPLRAQGVLKDVPSAHEYRGGFNAGFMSKDLRLALQLAGTARQPLPMGERAAQLYQQVIQRRGPLLLLLPVVASRFCWPPPLADVWVCLHA